MRQPRPLQRGHAVLGDWPVPDVHRVRRQTRGDRGVQVFQPGPAAGDCGKRRGQRGLPRHHLQDHLGQVDAGQHRGGPVAQVDQRRRFLDGLHPGQVDLPLVIDADLGVDGQPPADLVVGRVQGAGVLGQQRVRVLRQSERGQYVRADRLPRWAFQKPGLGVAPLGGGVGVDVSAFQMTIKLLQHAEGVGVAVHRAALVGGVAEHQALPRAGHHRGVDHLGGDQRRGQAAAVPQRIMSRLSIPGEHRTGPGRIDQLHAVREYRSVDIDGDTGDAAPVRRIPSLGHQVIERGVRMPLLMPISEPHLGMRVISIPHGGRDRRHRRHPDREHHPAKEGIHQRALAPLGLTSHQHPKPRRPQPLTDSRYLVAVTVRPQGGHITKCNGQQIVAFDQAHLSSHPPGKGPLATVRRRTALSRLTASPSAATKSG